MSNFQKPSGKLVVSLSSSLRAVPTQMVQPLQEPSATSPLLAPWFRDSVSVFHMPEVTAALDSVLRKPVRFVPSLSLSLSLVLMNAD